MIIILGYCTLAAAFVIGMILWLNHWSNKEWNRHWNTVQTMLGCACGDPNEVTITHHHTRCTTKELA